MAPLPFVVAGDVAEKLRAPGVAVTVCDAGVQVTVCGARELVKLTVVETLAY